MALSVSDNFFTLTYEAADQKAAIALGSKAADLLLRHLTLEQGDLFTYRLLQIEADTGETCTLPLGGTVPMFKATMYRLDQLSHQITAAFSRLASTDDRLDRALLYYEHARFVAVQHARTS